MDREKVVDWLEKEIEDAVYPDIPRKFMMPLELAEHALALLKAQEPRVMQVGDVRNWVNSDRVKREPVVIEIRGGVCAWIIDDEVRELPGEENLSSDLYGKTWRCWTSRPSDEQRQAVKWE